MKNGVSKTVLLLCGIGAVFSLKGYTGDSSGSVNLPAQHSTAPVRHARPINMDLAQQYKYFKQRLELARKAGGSKVVTDRENRFPVFQFFIVRHALVQSLKDADPTRKGISPELLNEIREAIAASEKEIPTPEGLVFQK